MLFRSRPPGSDEEEVSVESVEDERSVEKYEVMMKQQVVKQAGLSKYCSKH